MKIIEHLKAISWSIKSPWMCWWSNLIIQYRYPDSRFSFPIQWQYDDIHAIKLGSQVTLGAFSEIVVAASSQFSNRVGELVIEDCVVVGAGANIRAAGGKILIRKNALIAQHVSLIASNHQISSRALYRDSNWNEAKTDVLIGENVWLGAGVTVLPGCTIGDNSVIGAGSVVTKSIPANEIWAGVPAKKLREIQSPEALAVNKSSYPSKI